MIKVIGAGMAGLLAAHALRSYDPIIYEAQAELPHNHSALLRFRTNKISELTGIPFKPVHVQKAVWDGEAVYDRASMAMSNAYSLKVTGRISGRSILNLEPVTRYIAPPDFIAQLAEGIRIEYNSPMDHPEECVSTIPMPALMKICGWESAATVFEAKRIWTVSFDITEPDVDVYQTIYSAQGDDSLYRASITGRHVTLEFMEEPIIWECSPEYISSLISDFFGFTALTFTMPEAKSQKYGKLLPVDDDTRQSFILHATDVHRIYSVGRFATWRQILLDDVVDDLKIVSRMISQRSRYASLINLHK